MLVLAGATAVMLRATAVAILIPVRMLARGPVAIFIFAATVMFSILVSTRGATTVMLARRTGGTMLARAG